MFSMMCAVLTWAAESANDLLDLANMGRDANNVFVLAVAAILAAIRIAALLIFTLPALGWLKRQIWPTRERRRGDDWIEERGFRVFVVVLIVASIAFEVFVTPERESGADAEERSLSSYADYDGM